MSGVKETINYQWKAFGQDQSLEAGVNLHGETFKDRFVVADSSRWARNGRTATDLWYRMWSVNGFVRNEFNVGSWGITPILRMELVDMYRQNLITLAQNPLISSTEEGKEPNVYSQFLPGLTLEYHLKKVNYLAAYTKA